MTKSGSSNGKYPLIFLFFFLFGSLMSLIYLAPISKILVYEKGHVLFAATSILLISCFVSTSLAATALLPVFSVLMGICAGLCIDNVKALLGTDGKAVVDIAAILIIVPLQFVINCRGMKLSLQLRDAMRRQKREYHKDLFITYTIMLIGTVVFILIVRAC